MLLLLSSLFAAEKPQGGPSCCIPSILSLLYSAV